MLGKKTTTTATKKKRNSSAPFSAFKNVSYLRNKIILAAAPSSILTDWKLCPFLFAQKSCFLGHKA